MYDELIDAIARYIAPFDAAAKSILVRNVPAGKSEKKEWKYGELIATHWNILVFGAFQFLHQSKIWHQNDLFQTILNASSWSHVNAHYVVNNSIHIELNVIAFIA